MLTARGSEDDKISGLTLGVDDYIIKPFSIRELVTRVHAVLCRPRTSTTPPQVTTPLIVGDLILDPVAHQARVGGGDHGAHPHGVRATGCPRPAPREGRALHLLKIYPRGVYTGEQYRPIPPTRRSFPMITSPPRLLPMASHGCSCCGPASRADTVSNPAASDSSAGGSSSSYQVTGLTCGHCAKSVTQALQALPQVDDVQVDLAAGGVSTVTVTGVVPPETVRRAIEATGYTVLS